MVVASSESDAEYTPSESDDASCLTPETASNAPSESHGDCTARSTGGLYSETRTIELVNDNAHLQLLKSGVDGDQSHLQRNETNRCLTASAYERQGGVIDKRP